MTESDLGEREAARERQSYVRHELRAPLAVMYPALSMLLDGSAGELTPKQREYLGILERSAERLERLLGGQQGPLIQVEHAPGPRAVAWADRELVGRSGGSIAIRSEVGAGATVTVTLQAAGAG